MSRNTIIVLIQHRHKLLDLAECLVFRKASVGCMKTGNLSASYCTVQITYTNFMLLARLEPFINGVNILLHKDVTTRHRPRHSSSG
jgi:hypothetical protein